MKNSSQVVLKRSHRALRRRLLNSLSTRFEKLVSAAEAYASDADEDAALKRLSALAKAVKDMQGIAQMMPDEATQKENKDIELQRIEITRRLAKFGANSGASQGTASS